MIRLFRRRRLVVAGALVLCVVTASAYGAHRLTEPKQHRDVALYTFANNPAWFQSELDRVAVSGGKITLPAGRVPPLTLLALSPTAPIRLVGRSSTVLSGISIKRSHSISVSGMRIAPGNQPAIADVRDSQDILFSNVRFLGVEEDRGVAVQLDSDDADVTISHSEFSRCQHGLACILAQGRQLTIDHVRFHTVRDADVIRGAAADVTISDSDLHDALPGTHGDNHNDLIQILGGGPWTIQRNHFGVRANGAAQVYVDSRSGPEGFAHDVHVDSNVFTGSNKDMYFAIQVRDPGRVGDSGARRDRDRQQHDHLRERRGDHARRPVLERAGGPAPARREQHPRAPEARPVRRRARPHQRRREGADVSRRQAR